MIGHDDDGIDFQRTRLANGSKGIVQNIDGLIRSQNRTTAIRHKGKEEGATGNNSASNCMGNVGLRCANPSYLNCMLYSKTT